jgi:predicted O-methyltransferase YrrM
MLSPAKVQLLLETARQTLHLPGHVLEVGAWQGGSAWSLARLLLAQGLDKQLVLLDFFEELPRTNPEGVMCLDEIRHWFSFYPGAEIHSGNVDLRPAPLVAHEWCFIHYDAGFSAERLARCFDQLQVGGIIVLDNYGHIAANPGRFQRWFEARGHAVSSPPDSEQGWVLKHGSGA